MKPKIDKGLPIPKGNMACVGVGAKWRDILEGMEPGDSFVASSDHNDQKNAFRAAKQLGLTVKTRMLEDGRFRIWRVN